MNDNAKKWVAALRSGKYVQGRSALCKNGKYCCLGVACEIYIESGGSLQKTVSADGAVSYSGDNSAVPIVVQKWLGLSTECAAYNESSLIRHNDAHRRSFAQIADIIESQPPGLFKE